MSAKYEFLVGLWGYSHYDILVSWNFIFKQKIKFSPGNYMINKPVD